MLADETGVTSSEPSLSTNWQNTISQASGSGPSAASTFSDISGRAALNVGAARIHRDRPGPWLQILSARGFEWTRAELPVVDLPNELVGFRILHLTDVHARRRWDPAYEELIRRVSDNPPDLIVNTGDFVDNRFNFQPGLANALRLVSRLKSRLGMVGILGNHDSDLIAPALAREGVHMLDDRRLILRSGSAGLELIGMAGVERFDLDLPFLRGLEQRPPRCVRIALAHYPDVLRKTRFLQPDLYFAGHTHGGQICLPGRRPIIRHDSLPRHLCTGIHRAFDTWLIVNRGLGFSSKTIVRVFCPTEVIEIRLVPA